MKKKIDGAALLTEVKAFLSRFVIYPSEAMLIAHVLWIMHTHLMHLWESTPRIAFMSTEAGSGKSRALEVTSSLVPEPVHAINATPAYLFRKVASPEGVTVLFDEIDTIFGPKAKDNEEIRGMLNAGHRRGAMAGRCVTRGNEIVTEDLPAYCAVALAGLDDLPDTIRTRSVLVRMRRRGPGESVEPWRTRIHEPEGEALRDRLSAWAAQAQLVRWPDMPDGVEDRNADVWEPLLAVAEMAGGDWPELARVAAVTAVTDAAVNGRQSFGVLLLADLRRVFGASKVMSTDDILSALHRLEDSPWGDLRGREMTARDLASRLRKYTDTAGDPIRPQAIRVGDDVFKGYRRTDLLDAWARYLPTPKDDEQDQEEGPDVALGEPLPPSDVTVTSVTPVTPPREPVTAVTGVTAESQDRGSRCTVCGKPLDSKLLAVEDHTTHATCIADGALL